MTKTIKFSVLVMAGMTNIAPAYEPKPKPRKLPEFIERTYIRPTPELAWKASEKRKNSLFNNVIEIRKNIDLKVKKIQLDEETTVTTKSNRYSHLVVEQLAEKLLMRVIEGKNVVNS